MVPITKVLMAWYHTLMDGRFALLQPDSIVCNAFFRVWNQTETFPNIVELVKAILLPCMVDCEQRCRPLEVIRSSVPLLNEQQEREQLHDKILKAGIHCLLVTGSISQMYCLEAMFLFYEIEQRYANSRQEFVVFVQRYIDASTNFFSYSQEAVEAPDQCTFEQYAQLSRSTIMAVPDQQILCTLCLNAFQVNDSIVSLPCNHQFHDLATSNCDGLCKWIIKHNACPLCRQTVIK